MTRRKSAQICAFVTAAAAGLVPLVSSGAVIIDQGDVGVECFLVLEGEAGIVTGGEHVATIAPGSVVGEMALIGHKPRNATVKAQTAMRLLSFDIPSFKKLLDEMPVAQKYIYDLLEARARENSGR